MPPGAQGIGPGLNGRFLAPGPGMSIRRSKHEPGGEEAGSPLPDGPRSRLGGAPRRRVSWPPTPREEGPMAVTIAVVGCLDTKGDELEFLARTIESLGARAWLVDTGVLGEASARARTSAAEVARAAGTTLEALRQANDRGAAVAAMADGAAEVVRELFGREEIQGIVGAGGSANTTIAAKAMRALPVGFPKVLVSTLASGDVSPWIDTKDIALIYSVVDIAGINRISARILTNAARAVLAKS